jgi:hypothetical protein
MGRMKPRILSRDKRIHQPPSRRDGYTGRGCQQRDIWTIYAERIYILYTTECMLIMGKWLVFSSKVMINEDAGTNICIQRSISKAHALLYSSYS